MAAVAAAAAATVVVSTPQSGSTGTLEEMHRLRTFGMHTIERDGPRQQHVSVGRQQNGAHVRGKNRWLGTYSVPIASPPAMDT